MHSRKIFILSFFLLSLCSLSVTAQNGTNSPFSRFGYGELNDNSIGANRAMGGLSIGMRQNNVINPSNPAAYSAIDSMTFMMDIGASLLGTFYNDANGFNSTINGNLEYLNLQFPIWKYFGFSAGIMPYTSTGYSFALSDSLNSKAHYTQTYTGTGGISEIYVGLSANIMNWVALGVNFYYMWGTINNTRSVAFKEASLGSISENSSLNIHDYKLRYGAQFFHTFGRHSFTLGGMFENRKDLNCKFTRIETTTADTTGTDDGFSLPMIWGVGGSYNFDNRLTIGLDYLMTDWSKAQYKGQTGLFNNRGRWVIGAEYRHNPIGRNYAERMYWRLGASLSDSYIRQTNAKDISLSFGFGFPLRNIGTIINTTFEYGHRGTQNTLSEHFVRFTLSASIAENWFFKRKL